MKIFEMHELRRSRNFTKLFSSKFPYKGTVLPKFSIVLQSVFRRIQWTLQKDGRKLQL